MTAQEYIDDIKLRLLRLNVDIDLSDEFILTMINRARTEVQIATYSLFPERYASIYSLSYSASDINNLKSDILSLTNSQGAYKEVNAYIITMPSNLMEIYNVVVSWDSTERGDDWSTNCRLVTKEELFEIQNHAWNVPTADNMIYTIEKVGNTQLLYMSDLSVAANDLASGDVNVDVWYISALSDLENITTAGVDDTDSVVSPEVEELVIYYAMLYCLEGIHDDIAYDYIKNEISVVDKTLKDNYLVKKERVGSLLPSKEGIA